MVQVSDSQCGGCRIGGCDVSALAVRVLETDAEQTGFSGSGPDVGNVHSHVFHLLHETTTGFIIAHISDRYHVKEGSGGHTQQLGHVMEHNVDLTVVPYIQQFSQP